MSTSANGRRCRPNVSAPFATSGQRPLNRIYGTQTPATEDTRQRATSVGNRNLPRRTAVPSGRCHRRQKSYDRRWTYLYSDDGLRRVRERRTHERRVRDRYCRGPYAPLVTPPRFSRLHRRPDRPRADSSHTPTTMTATTTKTTSTTTTMAATTTMATPHTHGGPRPGPQRHR